MAILDDLKDYLGPSAGAWDDPVLVGVLATETAAQAARCRAISPVPADLAEALLRRCQRNLALRALPLGLTDVSGDAGNRSFVPGSDPEVRRLEAPYRRLVVG